MNQILVTEKVYVTPELKRKKKMYKILFMISIFAIISLCSLYIYAEYDRNKESSISKDMMLLLNDTSENGDISSNEQALIVMLTQDMERELKELYQRSPLHEYSGR